MVGNVALWLTAVVMLVLVYRNEGYTYRGRISTEDGFCDMSERGFGKIAVGETGYSETLCEKAECRQNSFEAYGCGRVLYDQEKCREVAGSGNYPECCPKVICDEMKTE